MKVFRYLPVFLFLLLFLSCDGMNSPQEINWNEPDYSNQLTAEEVQADIAQIIEKTESTHPYLTMKETPQSITDNYKVAKEKLQAINTGMVTLELWVEMAEYLASFSDTHTTALKNLTDNSLIVDVPFLYRLDTTTKKLVVTGSFTGGANDAIPVGTVITEIGGIASDVLIDTFSKVCGQENSASIGLITAILQDVDLLKYAGCTIINNEIVYEFGTGESKKMRVITETETEFSDKYPVDNTEKTHSYEKKSDGSLYLRMRAMYDNDGSFEDLLSAVETEIANGVKNVVLDIRFNGGGNSGIIYWLPTTYSYYIDSDDKKVDNIIIPDIVVPLTEDALDYVKWD